MAHYSANPIALDLQPTYLLAILLAVAAFTACGVVQYLPIWLAIKWVMMVLMLISAWFYIAQEALLLLPWSFIRMEINAGNALLLTRRDGTVSCVDLMPNGFVTAYLTVLNVKYSDSRWRRSLILSPDRVDAQAFRRLRVWLRWGSLEPALKSGAK